MQQKTGRPVPFELIEPTREALAAWLRISGLRGSDCLFLSRSRTGGHLITRQYGRLLDDWVALIGLDPAAYGTHSLGRTKVALEVDDVLVLSEQTDLWDIHGGSPAAATAPGLSHAQDAYCKPTMSGAHRSHALQPH